jgi:hypothetical protein
VRSQCEGVYTFFFCVCVSVYVSVGGERDAPWIVSCFFSCLFFSVFCVLMRKTRLRGCLFGEVDWLVKGTFRSLFSLFFFF